MKTLAKVLAVVIVMAMALSLVPALEAPASAAGSPILVLSSSTAVNPILDHVLSSADFASGGDHTVTFEWRAVGIKSNDAADPNAAHAFVGVTGTPFGSASGENTVTGKPDGIKGTTNWAKVTMTFGNVGVYGVSGSNYPGNILRFGLWKAKGELQIKNLQIKTGSTVKYDLNTDPVVAQAVANTEAQGLTECDLGELAAIDFENCPWTAGQFSTGNYVGYLRFETGNVGTTTSSLTRPPQSTTTKATTTQPTTQKPTSSSSSSITTQKPVTTPKPTTVTTPKPTTVKPTQGNQDPCAKGHTFSEGFCIYCAASDPDYDPCAQGHSFVNGYCIYCLEVDPTFTTAPTPTPTPAPTTAPIVIQTNPNTTVNNNVNNDAGMVDEGNNQGGISIDPVWLIVFVMVFAVGICVVVLYATGVFNKKK